MYCFLVYTEKLKFYTALSLLQCKGIATIFEQGLANGHKARQR